LTLDNQKKESDLKNAKQYIQELQSEISTLNHVIEGKNSQIVAVSNELQAALSEKRSVEEYKVKIATYEQEVQQLRNHTVQITNSLVTVQTFKDKEIEDLKKSQSDFQTKENGLLSLITQKSSEIDKILTASRDKDSKLGENQTQLSLLESKVAKYEEENRRLAQSYSSLEQCLHNVAEVKDKEIEDLNRRLYIAEETKSAPQPVSQPIDKVQLLEQAPKVYKSKINFEGWDKDSKKSYREYLKGDLSILKTISIHLLSLNKKCPVCRTTHLINPHNLKYLSCKCRTVIYCRNCAKKPKCTCAYGSIVKDLTDDKLPFRVNQ
jgi:DNA repair exonuclease SbcCD ATPase subunit